MTSNNSSSMQTLLRIFSFRRSSSSPKSKKEASTNLFRAFFSEKSSSHKKQPKKTKKNLKKMMRKIRRSSSSTDSLPALALVETFETASVVSSSSSSTTSSPIKSPCDASLSSVDDETNSTSSTSSPTKPPSATSLQSDLANPPTINDLSITSSSINPSFPLAERQPKVRFSDVVEAYDAVALSDDDMSSAMDSYDTFEDELSFASRETLDKFPELREQSVLQFCDDLSSAASSMEDNKNEVHLTIDCAGSTGSSEQGVVTPPSSTTAWFEGEWLEWSDSWSVGNASPLAQCVNLLATAVRKQDIFLPAVKAWSPTLCREADEEEDLCVRFNPSFDGIEMVRSFEEPLETIEEEPCAIDSLDSCLEVPMMSKVEGTDIAIQDTKSVPRRLFLAVFLLFFFAASEAGVPMANVVGPKLIAMLTSSRKAGPAPTVPKSFFTTHHTPVGVWLK